MIRTFQVVLKPTKKQREILTAILSYSCDLYNAALQERREAFRRGVKINYYHQQDELTQLHHETGLDGVAVRIARDPLRRVNRAFQAFFGRVRTGAKPGYPRFRAKHRYDSFTIHQPKFVGNSIRVPNLGCVKFKSGWWIDGTVKTATMKRLSKKWVASISVDIGPAPEKRPIQTAAGIDLGLTDFITVSDSSSVPNPKWQKKEADRVAAAGRVLARKQRGSNNRAKAREQLRRAHQRVADQRRNFCHHVSKALVNNFDLIAYEDLKIANMARGHFAKSILDAAWAELIRQLTYKAESAGKWLVPVNPRGTSQRCSGCGAIVKKTLSERIHSCPTCGLELGRDHNAALNVLTLGMSVAGESLQNVRGRCV